MEIKQFEDKNLSHYAYAIRSEETKEIVLIDPARDIDPYLRYAAQYEARIIAVIETHPHADFVSGHLELYRRIGATLYCSRLQDASYPHEDFDDGNSLRFGEITLYAWNTPGHSPDSICIVLAYRGEKQAVFTGDTLFIGDCGRPDLREHTGKVSAKREDLARQMYHSLRERLLALDDTVIIYPAHGAGTLCGKALSEANSSTIGRERISNWSLQQMDEDTFVHELIAEQPFIPQYFPYDVALNKQGVMNLDVALANIAIREAIGEIQHADLLIDTRPAAAFKAGHWPGAINIPDGVKFETWLGSVVAPQETFVLLGADRATLASLIKRIAKIGYEPFIRYAAVVHGGETLMPEIPLNDFKVNPNAFTVVDIRNVAEAEGRQIFDQALTIPLYELRERIAEIPLDKPVVVHCAGGYRSAIGSSILNSMLNKKTMVYDLGEAIRDFY